jgi:hypothetical protein
MQWTRVAMPESIAVVGLAARQRNVAFAATKSGELLEVNLLQASIGKRTIVPGVSALACHANGSVVCVGSKGAVALCHDDRMHQEVVDEEVMFTSVSYDEDATICAVGQYDDRTGVVFRRLAGDGEWSRVHVERNPPGLLAVSASRSRSHVICGRRGYAALWDHQTWTQIDTGTDHPLRAALITTSGRWFVGGGGWAAEMPILTEGEGSVARSVINAPGNRVIVGIVEDSSGTLWLGENRSDGKQWEGVLLRFNGHSVVPSGDRFEERLSGITCVGDRLMVCGAGGLVAWADIF